MNTLKNWFLLVTYHTQFLGKPPAPSTQNSMQWRILVIYFHEGDVLVYAWYVLCKGELVC